ncbi:recombinase family protein [Neobacillus niacini]|uniref:recombinase family protein n=1 Tax=Neobacillus niacini TaxID=86668 RepID=UPI0007AB8446|nr:recombinase family protein [Neobacillus niacini]MEC1526087.1 recombinase family protein [Neobacillus niacini]
MSNKIENVLYIRSANNSIPSINSQRLYGENYAKQNSLHLSIIEDAHISGLTPINERSGLRWLIHLVEVGLIKTVIIDSYHRISRDLIELSSFLSLLKKHNAKLIVLVGGGEFDK